MRFWRFCFESGTVRGTCVNGSRLLRAFNTFRMRALFALHRLAMAKQGVGPYRSSLETAEVWLCIATQPHTHVVLQGQTFVNTTSSRSTCMPARAWLVS